MAFKTFTATSEKIFVVITDPNQPYKVEIILTDGSAVEASYVGSTGNDHSYEYAGDFSDGVFTAVVYDQSVELERSTIANQKTSTNCLLKRVLNGEYDCKLMQEIEIVTTLIQNSEGELAQKIYKGIQDKCTECENLAEAPLEGISIWIVDNDFIVQ